MRILGAHLTFSLRKLFSNRFSLCCVSINNVDYGHHRSIRDQREQSNCWHLVKHYIMSRVVHPHAIPHPLHQFSICTLRFSYIPSLHIDDHCLFHFWTTTSIYNFFYVFICWRNNVKAHLSSHPIYGYTYTWLALLSMWCGWWQGAPDESLL